MAIFHAVDRAAEENGVSSSHLRQVWCKESVEFKLVDVLAHHFKLHGANLEGAAEAAVDWRELLRQHWSDTRCESASGMASESCMNLDRLLSCARFRIPIVMLSIRNPSPGVPFISKRSA